MQFLRGTVPGQYLDGFLYRGHLYLLRRDSSLELVDWDELVSTRFPGPDNQIDPLAELVFVNNSLAHVDQRMLRWSGYPELRQFFEKRLKAYRNIDFSIDGHATRVDLGGRAVHSLEIYFSHLWLAGESGVAVCQCGPGFRGRRPRSQLSNVISGHSFSATPERRFVWVAQRGATVGLPVEEIASNRVGVRFGSAWELPFSTLSVGWHWSDPTFASRDDLSSRAFVRASWLEPNETTDLRLRRDEQVTQQRRAAVREDAGNVILVDGKRAYLEIELGDLGRGRLFCSRERAVVQDSKGLTALDWKYDFSRSKLNVAEVRSQHGSPERVLISTFGWVVEGETGVSAYTRFGCIPLVRGEVVQVRTFPSSLRYENIVLIVLEDHVEIVSTLDYDFLLPPLERVSSIGRRSEFYSSRPDDRSA